jgi:Right handed beta helix region
VSGVTIQGNVISANTGDGIEGDGAFGTQIAGNIIGTGYGGNESLPDGEDGIDLIGASQEVSITGNQLVDNKGDGIGIHGDGSASPTNSYVAYNVIGTIPLPQGGYATGMGNLGNGVAISGAGATDVIGNVIDSNGISGVATYAAQPIYVEYNQIGIDPDGDRGMGNNGDGVQFTYSSGLILGNGIGSNGTDGVALLNAPDNTIQANSIGTDAEGQGTVMGNQGNGLSIVSSDGQVSTGENVTLNKIVENQRNGVEVEGLTQGLTLSQNQIGGFLAVANPPIGFSAGNAKDGILLDDVTLPSGSSGFTVALSNNFVADNGNDGLQVIGGGSFTSTSDSFITNAGDGVEFDSGATGNTLVDDSIVGNQAFGVLINQSPDNTLTGVTIENNTGQGLDIIDSPGIVITGGTDTGNNEGGVATPFV